MVNLNRTHVVARQFKLGPYLGITIPGGVMVAVDPERRHAFVYTAEDQQTVFEQIEKSQEVVESDEKDNTAETERRGGKVLPNEVPTRSAMTITANPH